MTKTQNLPLKIIKVFSLSVFYIVIALLLIFSVATLAKKSEDQVANFLGYGFLTPYVNEQTGQEADSMDGNRAESFTPNDLVIVKVFSDKDREALDMEQMYEDELVISFYDRTLRRINTHRIVGYDTDSSGDEYFRTQGDKEGLEMDSHYIHREDIIAVYSSKVKGAAGVIRFMQSPLGFGIIVVLPMLALLIYQAVVLIINIYKV